MEKAFYPHYGTGQTLSVTNTSASTTLLGGLSSDDCLCITNTGGTDAYIRTLPTTSTATAADMLIPAGASVIISVDSQANVISYVTASGTTNLHVIFGSGI